MRAHVTVFLISLFCLPCVRAAAQTAPAFTPLDHYGRIRWDEEKTRLDHFAEQLKKEPQMIGYIYVREAQISCEGYAVAHAIELKKYLVETHHLPWNRIAWRDLGYGNSYEVTLWLFAAGEPPKYQPVYQSEATYVEDCESVIRRSKWWGAKRRASNRAANKRLERTRR